MGGDSPDEWLKDYLLGKLPSPQMDAIEESYFAHREVLLVLRDVEDRLIRAYLQDNLPQPDRLLFEARYLHIPELTKRLNEVRSSFEHQGKAPNLPPEP